MSNGPSAPQKDADAVSAKESYVIKGRAALARLHNAHADPAKGSWLRAAGFAALPIALAVGLSLLVDLPGPTGDRQPPLPTQGDTTEAVDRSPGLTAARLEAAERLAEMAPDTLDALSTDELAEEIEALSAFAAAQSAGETGALVASHSSYRAQLLFWVSVIILLTACAASTSAQRGTIQSMTSGYWPRVDRITGAPVSTHDEFLAAAEREPNLYIGGWVLLGGAVALALLLWFDHLMPWLPVIRADSLAEALADLSVRDAIAMASVGLSVASVFTVVAISGYGILLAARNYPDSRTLQAFYDELNHAYMLREAAMASSGNPDGERVLASDPPYKLTDFTADLWKGDPTKGPPCAASWSFKPKQFLEIVNAMSLPVILVMVIALVTLDLGLDVVERRLGHQAQLAEAIAASHNTVVIVTGALFSLTFAAIYGTAATRLFPYIEAEDYLKANADPGGPGTHPKAWTVAGQVSVSGQSILEVSEKPPPAKTPTPRFDEDLARYIAATYDKFTILLTATRISGGFHMLLEQGLMARTKTLLTLLAPTLASGILSALG